MSNSSLLAESSTFQNAVVTRSPAPAITRSLLDSFGSGDCEYHVYRPTTYGTNRNCPSENGQSSSCRASPRYVTRVGRPVCPNDGRPGVSPPRNPCPPSPSASTVSGALLL